MKLLPHRSFVQASKHRVSPLITGLEVAHKATVRKNLRDEESRFLVERLVMVAVIMVVTGSLMWLLKVTGIIDWIERLAR